MLAADSTATFRRDPVGRWVAAAPTVVVWCASAELCGAVIWGRPSGDDVERMLHALHYRHPGLAPRFDVVLDGRDIELIDPDAFVVMVAWLRERQQELAERIRIQIGVISETLVGVTLTGILPMLGDTHAFRLSRDPREALCEVSADGAAIAAAVDEAVRGVRGAPDELRRLRDLLRKRPVAASIEESARALAVSVRTLQRLLQSSGTSFREELREARFAVALPLLVQGGTKVASVASRVGLSERALTELARDKTGATPGELRKR